MKLRYKIFIALILALAIFFAYDFLANPPLKSASNTSLEGFICSNETKTFTVQEKEQREQRETELRKALSNTIGIRMEGHGIELPGIGPKIKRVYEMQAKLSIEDWDILSEVFMKDYRKWWLNSDDMAEAIRVIFAAGGKEAIAILECRIDNTDFSLPIDEMFFKNRVSEIEHISGLNYIIEIKNKYKEEK
ncbi:MAG: hypothetical protein LBL65_07945 [Campylobacteraceae bacterium]|jgi:hypothetical protein|nr:hypothetical protein [Campylobacteraceae bacterium]